MHRRLGRRDDAGIRGGGNRHVAGRLRHRLPSLSYLKRFPIDTPEDRSVLRARHSQRQRRFRDCQRDHQHGEGAPPACDWRRVENAAQLEFCATPAVTRFRVLVQPADTGRPVRPATARDERRLKRRRTPLQGGLASPVTQILRCSARPHPRRALSLILAITVRWLRFASRDRCPDACSASTQTCVTDDQPLMNGLSRRSSPSVEHRPVAGMNAAIVA